MGGEIAEYDEGRMTEELARAHRAWFSELLDSPEPPP